MAPAPSGIAVGAASVSIETVSVTLGTLRVALDLNGKAVMTEVPTK
jgi:hypothetical protein